MRYHEAEQEYRRTRGERLERLAAFAGARDGDVVFRWEEVDYSDAPPKPTIADIRESIRVQYERALLYAPVGLGKEVFARSYNAAMEELKHSTILPMTAADRLKQAKEQADALQKTISALEVDVAREERQKDYPWRPEIGSRYFYLDSLLHVNQANAGIGGGYNDVYPTRADANNVFKDAETAKKAQSRVAAILACEAAANTVGDLALGGAVKYGGDAYSPIAENIGGGSCVYRARFSHLVSPWPYRFTSREACERFIKIVGQTHLNNLYNFNA